MKITVISPTGVRYEGQADKVELPSVQGRMMVLKHHAPLMALLTSGTVRVGNADEIAITGGVVRVQDDEITVLAD